MLWPGPADDTAAHLDGNCLAGPLSEILTAEPATAWWRRPECALSGPLAELHVYGPGPGLTARCPLPAARCPLPAARCPLPAARCPGCAYIAVRIVKEEGHIWLTMGGGTGAFRFTVA